jgi:hypothetical protein
VIAVNPWGGLYRDHVSALTALAGELDDAQLSTHVPATPAWTVRDVYAHLAGGAADALTGRMDGAPGPEWTSRHVGERARLPLPVLLDELTTQAGDVAASVADNPSPALVWDIAVHHADLHEALDLGRPPERLWLPVLEAAGPRMLGRAGVRVRCDGRLWGEDPAEADHNGAHHEAPEVPAYELFRAVFSRRSRTQVRRWAGPGWTDEQVDALGVFGPRIDEQPQPV